MKRWIAVTLVLLPVIGWVGLGYAADRVADKLNPVYRKTPYTPRPAGDALHRSLLIADLHADPLLWDRDLTRRNDTGHVDVPRLLAGNVAIQVFGVVTKTPKGMNTDRNDDSTDNIRLLAVAQKWPPATWTSLKARALYQAQKLARTAERSDGALTFIRSRPELEAFLKARESKPRQVGALLALEGLHALEGDAANVQALHDAGFRLLGLAHFFDNEVSGSAHGMKKGGLTPLGREVLARMEASGMTVDLAHASAKAISEVLAVATKPVVVSHTGVKGTCRNNRNLSDEQLRAIAANRGVVGIGFWKTATCGTDAKAIARAVRHAVDVAGVDHVGLGSDYDGAVAVPFDVAGLVELTDALMAQGFSERELQKIMGGNVLRVLRMNLPQQ